MKQLVRTFTLGLSLLAGAAAQAINVRDLKYEITDTAIVFPESTQADVHRMQQNWYIENYTALGSPADGSGDMSDSTLISRLQSMPTTIEMPFNPVVRSHIDLYVNRRRQLVEAMLGMSLYYMPIFEEALEREGLPLELKYLPVIESALNPDAVSRAGATGLWQFMLPTAKGLGIEVNTLVDQRRDPMVSSAMAAKYLKQLYGIFNDWGLAIAAYNCGPGNVNKALARAGATADSPKDYWDIYYYLPAETRGYVPGFIGATYAMTHYADHGISPSLARRPILVDTVHVNNRICFEPLATALKVPIEELRVLNPQYRRDIIPGDQHPYALRLPSQMVYTYLMLEDSIVSASSRLAPRATVELGSAQTSGDYKEVVKWHKVRRGESLAQIARKYGVTQSDIKKWNGLRSSKLNHGKSLKIVTRQAIVEPVKPQPDTTVPAEGEVEVVVEEQPDTSDTSDTSDQSDRSEEPATVTHRVAKGDTLFGLAKKYGVTVDQIKQANSMSDSGLKIGQKITIPQK